MLNPSGILFGPNAQLDVSGSFHATTANYIGLADGVLFNAVPSSADNLLTTAPPAAFGFLPSNPAPALIDVQAGVGDFEVGITNVLQVPAGQTLSFVGGPISVGAAPGAFAGGFVLAPGGRINLVSVASPGEAKFDGTGFSVDTFARLGDISIKGNGILDAKEVFIRGGRLVIEHANILPGFFFLNGVSGDPPNGGEVNIQVSDSVNIKGPPSDFNGFSGILTAAGLPFPGDVPHIRIKASSISLSEGGVVQTVRQGPGNPSNISIEADTVEVRSGASIAARNEFEGPGGTLTVNARNVTLDSAGSDPLSPVPTGLSAQAFFHPDYGFADETGSFAKAFLPSLQLADSGSITVNATGTLTMRGSAQISSDNFAFGKSGNVTINAGDMLLVGAGANTGLISAQSRLAGRAGDVTVNATGSIDMQNGFRISANTLGSDDGGQANVKAGRSITMSGNSTFISSITSQPVDSDLDSFAELFFSFFQATRGIEILDYPSLRAALGVAPGPNDLMNVLAALSTISDGAGNPLVALTDFTPGAGGKVSITAPVLAVNDGAHIETSTVWDGNAGAIEVNVGSLTVRDGAIIGSRSGAVRPDRGFTVGAGNAGTVNIAATDTVEISGRSPTSGEGSIVTTNTFGDGNAGNISLSANQVNIQNGAIVASATGGTVNGQLIVGTGNAGQISVSTPTLTMADGTISVATSGSGSAGSIFLNGNTLSLTGGAQVVSSTTGAGQGGSVTVSAPGSLSVSGSGTAVSGLFSTAESTGSAGQIAVTTPALTMGDGGTISVATSNIGNAGSISLNVSNFTQTGGSRVESSTSGAGTGGTLGLTAGELVSISGAGSGLFSTASSTGNAGQITVAAPGSTPVPTLTMADGGKISVATSGGGSAGSISLNANTFGLTGGAQVVSSTTGAGQGGSVTVSAPGSLSISGSGTAASGLFSTAESTGSAGQIAVTTPTLTMGESGTISVATEGSGNAGNVSLNVSNFTQTGGSRVESSTSGAGAGGTLGLTGSEFVSISGTGSGLFSTASSTGNAGQITVAAPGSTPVSTLIMTDGGKISVATSGGGSAGSISLNANTFSLTGGAQVVSSTTGAGQGGSVTVSAPGSLSVSGSGTAVSGLFSTAESTGSAGQIAVTTPALTMGDGGTISVATSNIGNAGSISLNVSNFTQTGGSRVESSTSGAGTGGTLGLTAGELVSISGAGSGLFSTASSTGNAGQITVAAPGSTPVPTLTMADGGKISVATSGGGSAGSILLNANTFSLTGGAQVVSSTTGAGQGGSVTVSAPGSLSVSGSGSAVSGLFSTAESTGSAGQIAVTTPALTMGDGGTISVATSNIGNAGSISLNVSNFTQTGGSRVESSTSGAGTGGTLGLTAGELVSISGAGSGLFSTASSTGNAGQITVAAPGSTPVPTLTMADGGKISVATSGGGSAGSISLNANTFSLTGGAQVVSSTTGAGQGGSVTATAGESISISGSGSQPSGLFSTALSTGNAGQIAVSTPTLTMAESATITVATEGSGSAGNISVNVSNLTQTGGAQVVSSTTGAGGGGNLAVTAANSISISGSGSIPSGLFSTASNTGDAGEVTVSTPTLAISNGGTISVATSGAGNAGNALLNVSNFSLTGGAQIVSSTSGAGQGGTVSANATDSVSISGQGTGLFSTASGTGPGGTINIQTAQLQVTDAGVVSANSTGTATRHRGEYQHSLQRHAAHGKQ